MSVFRFDEAETTKTADPCPLPSETYLVAAPLPLPEPRGALIDPPRNHRDLFRREPVFAARRHRAFPYALDENDYLSDLPRSTTGPFAPPRRTSEAS